MNIPVNSKLVQTIVSYAAIIMGVLTTQLNGIKLPTAASIILGIFGVLLHPQTSITVPNEPISTPTATPAAGVEPYKAP